MPASYPSSAKSFTTKTTSQTIEAAHVNDLQDEVTAIETDLVAGLPATRGGTGLTAIPAAGFAPVSNGTIYVATDVSAGTAQDILAVQVFT